MIRKKFSSAFILMGTVLCASSASANMSPEEAWEYIVSRAQASDYVVSAIKSRDGDQLTVTDIVFRIDDFDAGFSLKFETGDWQFSQQADGSVRMDMAEDARWALRFKDMDDERVEIDLAQFSKDSLMVFKRDGDEIRSEYEFGSLRLDFLRLADEIEVIGKDQLQFSVTLNDISHAITIAINAPDETVFIIGQAEEANDGWLSNSVYAHILADEVSASAPPPVDLTAEAKHGDMIRQLNAKGLITAAHDIGDGGALTALAEMVLAGSYGAELIIPQDQRSHGWAFGEDQGRYLIVTHDPDAVVAAAKAENIPLQKMATTISSKELKLGPDDIISVKDLRSIHESWLPDMMSQKKGA